MIQRIQSLYLIISIICLIVASSGMAILKIAAKGYDSYVSAYGKMVVMPNTNPYAMESIPFYIAPIVLVFLCSWTIMSFKKIKFQLQLGRVTFLLYTVSIALLILYSELAEPLEKGVETSYGFAQGFFIFVAGLPFVFLANLGIRKDKKLLDSLNRLR